jgi:hypothetical protein
MVYLLAAEWVSDYCIRLVFSTGEVGVVDLQDIPDLFPAAEVLRDKEKFQDFYLDSWPTLAGSNGFDLAPEMLYERACQSGLQPSERRA